MKTKTLFLPHRFTSRNCILSIIFLFIFFVSAKAQECTTPDILPQEAMNYPWFGNPDYLPSFMDSVRSVEGIPSQYARIVPDIKWRIPIKFWILTTGESPDPNNLLDDNTGQNLPQEQDLQRLLDDVNSGFRNTEVPSGIQFYLKDVDRVEVSNTAMSAANINLRISILPHEAQWTLYDTEAINVYITTEAGGFFHSVGRSLITISRRSYTNRDDASTLTHEIGHYFGLGHTHQFSGGNYIGTWCFREPVTRGVVSDPACFVLPINIPWLPFVKRCSYTGDYLCDTPADPNLGEDRNNGVSNDARNVSGNCNQYIQFARVVDYRGDLYTPLLDNYMRYGQNECINTFTKGQVGVMWWVLKNTPRGRFGKWKVDVAGRSFDIYEPNNTISGAISADREGLAVSHILQLNVPQLHSFHKDIDGDVLDNEDWIAINNPENGVLEDYTITVESTIANFIRDIEVFTAASPNGISIPRNLAFRISDTITVSNQTRWQISIPCDIVNNPNQLYLRVRRNQSLNEFGTYTVLATSNFLTLSSLLPIIIQYFVQVIPLFMRTLSILQLLIMVYVGFIILNMMMELDILLLVLFVVDLEQALCFKLSEIMLHLYYMQKLRVYIQIVL